MHAITRSARLGKCQGIVRTDGRKRAARLHGDGGWLHWAMFRFRSQSSAINQRTVAILGLLLACLAFTATLGWQAWQAQQSNASVAASLIHDYSALAADEFERRFTSALSGYGHKTLIKAIENADSAGEMQAIVGPGASEWVRSAAALSAGFFMHDGITLDMSGQRPSDELIHLITDLQRNDEDFFAPFQLAHTDSSDEQVIYLFRAEGDGTRILFGYVLDPAGFRGFIERSLGNRPLLPESAANGRVNNDMLFVEVLDPRKRTVYRVNPQFENALMAIREFAPDPRGGIPDGYSVHVSLDPHVASKLIIGGLPETRLPILLAALAASVMLLISAIWLFIREAAVMKLREEFVSQVSHELRTPLTQIRMFAETLLLGRARSPQEERRSLEIIDRESRRLSHLVENVLRISKVSDEIQLDSGQEALKPLLEDIAATAQSIHPSVTIELSIAGEPEAWIDRNAVRQVVINLLDNAIKYGPDGQIITVTAAVSGETTTLAVEDQGPGIPESERTRVWGTFYRLGRERDTAIGGTGIGLAVVRKLIKAMHGECRIETPQSGVGTRVVIEFPAHAPPRPGHDE